MSGRLFVCALAIMLLCASAAGAQGDPIIYPAKGQSQQQLDKDKAECYSWAKGQTGFDPMKSQQAPQASTQEPKKREVARGAARGAAAGAVVGAVSGDAGKGAAAGAAGGAVVGGVKKRQAKKQEAEAQQKQADAAAAGRAEYNRAFGACLEGRGYTVK